MYHSILEENKYQKEYLDSIYFSEIEKIIKSTETTLEDLNRQIIPETKSIEQSCLNAYHSQINQLAINFNNYFKQTKKKIEDLLPLTFSELQNAISISQQCEHNIQTAINALNSQKKITENSIYHGIKKLDIEFLQKKKYYSREIDQKILLLQEETNKTIKTLTEKQISLSDNIQKAFFKTHNPLKANDLKNLLNRSDILRFQSSTMKESIQSLLLAEKRHVQALQTELHRICNEICKIRDFSDELKLNQKKIGTDLHFAIRTCKQFLQLDEELKQIVVDTKRNNSQTICEKYKEYEQYATVLNQLQNENQRLQNAKRNQMNQINISQNEELEKLNKSLTLDKEKTKERYLKESIKYEEKLIHLKEILNQKMQEKFNTEMFSDSIRKENNIDQSVFNEDRNQLKKKFEDEIKEENERFKINYEEMKRTADSTNNQIAEATQELARLQAQLQSISSLNDEEVIIIDNNDEDELKDEIDHIINQQEKEYIDQLASNEKILKQAGHQFERDENNLALQIEDNYKQSIRNVTMIIKSDRNLFQTVEKEYQKEFDIELRKLNEIDDCPSLKGSKMYYNQNSVNPLFEKSDRLIESLKHRLLELRNSVSYQKVTLELRYSNQIEQEESRFKDEMKQFSSKTTELISLKQKLNSIQLEKMEMENQLHFELSKLKEENEKNMQDFLIKRKEIDNNNQFSLYSSVLHSLKNKSKAKIDQAINFFVIEIRNLTNQLTDTKAQIESKKDNYLNEIQRISNEIVLIEEKKVEQTQLIDNNIQLQCQQENDNFSIRTKNKNLQFEENKNRICNLIAMYKKNMLDEDNFHFFVYHQNRANNILIIDDLSKKHRDNLSILHSNLDVISDFQDEQIRVIQDKVDQTRQRFVEQPQRQSDSLIIGRLEKQLVSMTSQLTILCKTLKEIKDLYKKKEREYNHRFGINPKVGILKSKPFLVLPKTIPI